MDVQELRIGNLVRNKNNKVVKIGISSFRIHKDLKPIPLTEELLLKSGFKKIGNRYGNGHKRKVILNKQFYHSIAGYIKYVHQLQNLYFALTQTELEYDL